MLAGWGRVVVRWRWVVLVTGAVAVTVAAVWGASVFSTLIPGGFEDPNAESTRIEARVSSELLENLFVPNTPLHDGAVIIQGGTLLAAGCFLPMSANPDISQNLGSRHRAALGISEISDALVIVASEETGIISVAQEGKLIRYLDGSGLRSILMAVYAPDQAQKGINSLLHWRSRHEKRT